MSPAAAPARLSLPYGQLLALARRHARRPGEEEDIVQEVLIAAVAAGRTDFGAAADRRWLMGAIRRRAAFDARSAARRRTREARWQAERWTGESAPEGVALEIVLADLPKSLRVLAALALSGHTKAEILYLLDVSDAALRQRIRGLKAALAKKGVALPDGLPGLTLDLDYGRLRDALLPALRRHGGVLASHDPDGHVFVIKTGSQKR